MTHDELVQECAWLLKTTNMAVVKEAWSEGEIADCIGWFGKESVLFEAKTTRAQFAMDKNKSARKNCGVGNYRYYISEPDVIREKDLPEGWGLYHVSKQERIHRVKESDYFETSYDSEVRMLSLAVRKLQKKNRKLEIEAIKLKSKILDFE